jgi:hypothetical protein
VDSSYLTIRFSINRPGGPVKRPKMTA